MWSKKGVTGKKSWSMMNDDNEKDFFSGVSLSSSDEAVMGMPVDQFPGCH